jgi:hypothetical protein
VQVLKPLEKDFYKYEIRENLFDSDTTIYVKARTTDSYDFFSCLALWGNVWMLGIL